MKKNLFILSLLATISSVYSAPNVRPIEIGNMSEMPWNIRVSYGPDLDHMTDAATQNYQNELNSHVVLLPAGATTNVYIKDQGFIKVRVFPAGEHNFNTAGVTNFELEPYHAYKTVAIDIREFDENFPGDLAYAQQGLDTLAYTWGTNPGIVALEINPYADIYAFEE